MNAFAADTCGMHCLADQNTTPDMLLGPALRAQVEAGSRCPCITTARTWQQGVSAHHGVCRVHCRVCGCAAQTPACVLEGVLEWRADSECISPASRAM